jgi:hypothetical protein
LNVPKLSIIKKKKEQDPECIKMNTEKANNILDNMESSTRIMK